MAKLWSFCLVRIGLDGDIIHIPTSLKDTLAEKSLYLSAITLVEDWLNPQETRSEQDDAEFWFEFPVNFLETI